MLLVGDPAQLQSVDAGGAFGMLIAHRDDVPELTDVRRIVAAWEKDATLDLRHGRIEAIDTYRAHGRIHAGEAERMADAAYAAWQRDRAEVLGEALAAERGHVPLRLEAKPSFANILVWKVVYETATDFHVDAVRTWPSAVVYPGSSIPRLDTARDLPWLDPASQQARDVERFAWFSNDYVARDPQVPGRVIDVRYSLLPNEIDSLWSIQLTPGAGPEQHVSYTMHRNRRDGQVEILWQMLLGQPLSGSGEYRISGL